MKVVDEEVGIGGGSEEDHRVNEEIIESTRVTEVSAVVIRGFKGSGRVLQYTAPAEKTKPGRGH